VAQPIISPIELQSRYRAFSFRRINALARVTLTDLTRQKVFYFILLFGLVLIGSSVFLARFSFQQELQILKDVSLGAISMFTSLLAIVGTARLIPQDIEQHTAYSILAKPVPRYEYLLGRLFGMLALLLISTAVMTVLFVALLYGREQTLLHETARQYSAAPVEQLQEAIRSVESAGFSAELLLAATLLYCKAAVLAALTLLVTTFATTNIFTVVVMVFVYFIGHLQAMAREYWLQQHVLGWVPHIFMALVTLVFPDLQSFNVTDAVVAGKIVSASFFFSALGLGLFYVAVYTLLATVMFSGKEL
jgi:hypothetical protein